MGIEQNALRIMSDAKAVKINTEIVFGCNKFAKIATIKLGNMQTAGDGCGNATVVDA